ncbi:phage tail protein [Angustibacter aerolatus]
MTTTPQDPTPAAATFVLELDGVAVGRAERVEWLSVARQTIELREGGDPGPPRRLPGRWEAGDVTLTRGLTTDRGFQDWVAAELAADGSVPPVRRQAAVVVLAPDGAQLRRVVLHRAWPSRLAIGTDPAGRPVEVLTVVCDGVELG